MTNRPLLLFLSGLAVLILLVLAAQVAARLVELEPGATTLAVLAGAAALAAYAAVTVGGFFLLRRARQARATQALSLVAVDKMDGSGFEQYVKHLLQRKGYRVIVVGAPGDLGVDLIAVKGPEKYAVQVKRQHGRVSRRAVSDAVAGRAHYHCTAAMVVTSATFTNGALELARSNNCKLVDRQALAAWISSDQRGIQG